MVLFEKEYIYIYVWMRERERILIRMKDYKSIFSLSGTGNNIPGPVTTQTKKSKENALLRQNQQIIYFHFLFW